MFLWWLGLAILFRYGLAQQVCKSSDTDACKCDLVDGRGVVDISIGKQDKTPLFDKVMDPGGYYMYAYNPCYDFTSQNGSISGLATLQYNDESKQFYDIGQQSGTDLKSVRVGNQVHWPASTGSLYLRPPGKTVLKAPVQKA
uniref:uncharacterized protein LOC120344852 n=1 Tax=Styela clava TaxID=7725 RepID=UPI0019398313|nr:uncharacterized protein LOC120344852 [Styela clava]